MLLSGVDRSDGRALENDATGTLPRRHEPASSVVEMHHLSGRGSNRQSGQQNSCLKELAGLTDPAVSFFGGLF
jgi:hypothetical protein